MFKGKFFKGRERIAGNEKVFYKKARARSSKSKRSIEERNKIFDKMIKNYQSFKKRNIPIAELKEIKSSKRGLKRAYFEFLENMSAEEIKKREKGILGAIDSCLEGGIIPDVRISNFGIDKKNKVKIGDFYPMNLKHIEEEIRLVKQRGRYYKKTGNKNMFTFYNKVYWKLLGFKEKIK